MGRSLILVKIPPLGLGVRGFARDDRPDLASEPVMDFSACWKADVRGKHIISSS
jgi:hypothetical protein